MNLKMFELEKNENIYHITWVTHNSRISERMITYNIKKGEPLYFDDSDIKKIKKYIEDIIKEKHYNVPVYKVNSDHVHLLLICDKYQRDNIVRTIKSKTTYIYKREEKIKDIFHLWAQKYNSSIIKTEKELENVYHYILYNDLKHK